MAEGHDRDRWLHTATILAKLHNANVTDKKDVAKLADFYPFAIKVPEPEMDEDERQLALARIAAQFPAATFDIQAVPDEGKPSLDA